MAGGGEMGLSTRMPFRDGLVWAMGLFAAAAVVGGLALHDQAAIGSGTDEMKGPW
jgi:hypothetical protein